MFEQGDTVEVIAQGRYRGLRFELVDFALCMSNGIVFSSPFDDDQGGDKKWFTEWDIRKVNADCDNVSALTFDNLMRLLGKGDANE
jgi:hypothetical protein